LNRLLSAIGANAALRPHLRRVALEHKAVLFDIGDKIKNVVFPIDAIVSIVAQLHTGDNLEVAMVGRNGAAGVGPALGDMIVRTRAEVQHPGKAVICDAEHFRDAILGDAGLASMMFHHEQLYAAELQQSAICVANHQVESRLPRWLLRARDLAEIDTFRFTQEYLADMLAVRRTSVSPIANQFMDKGLVRYSRGEITILDVEGLEELACECYKATEAAEQMRSLSDET
jgi:CRP-like cAMP-binding protein